ncbi:Uncharacterized protein HZ326_28388 [Fusarium oxysporum f. sp. albedinis]|nr:Uncharacterized protein HZ326_28388 [Fusarium oxysporum f. sp. albedinis]
MIIQQKPSQRQLDAGLGTVQPSKAPGRYRSVLEARGRNTLSVQVKAGWKLSRLTKNTARCRVRLFLALQENHSDRF